MSLAFLRNKRFAANAGTRNNEDGLCSNGYDSMTRSSMLIATLSVIAILSPRSAASSPPTTKKLASNGPEFTYRGDWVPNDQLFQDRSASISSTTGADVSFDFEGKQLRIFRAYTPDQGRVRICIDAACQAVNNKSFYNLAAPQPWGKTFPTVGKHHVSMQVESGSFAFAGAEILPDTTAFPAGRFDDGDSRISFDGSWFIQHREGPWKATVHSSADPDAVASFRFDGTGIVVGAVLFDDRDNVQLCIDGTCHERRVFSPGLRWQEPIFVTGLQPGTHLAELRKKSGKLMDLDYIEVINERPLTAGEHPEVDPAINHIGDWSHDNPERLRSMSANAAIYVPFIGNGIRWNVHCDQFGGRVEACLNSSCHQIDTLSAEPTTRSLDFPAKQAESNALLVRKLTGRSLTSAGFSVY